MLPHFEKGGVLLGGYDLGINYVFDENEEYLTYSLPFHPLKIKNNMKTP